MRARFADLRGAYYHKVTVTNSQTLPPMTRIVLAAQEITFFGLRNYGSQKSALIVLKIGPYRCRKFGNLEKMLYLCNAFGKCIASVGGGSAKAKQACLCILGLAKRP